jgi:hypothetical protein
VRGETAACGERRSKTPGEANSAPGEQFTTVREIGLKNAVRNGKQAVFYTSEESHSGTTTKPNSNFSIFLQFILLPEFQGNMFPLKRTGNMEPLACCFGIRRTE